MPTRSIFIDAADEFYIKEGGHLVHRYEGGNEVEEKVLVVRDNLDEFIGWLTDENARLASEAETKTSKPEADK